MAQTTRNTDWPTYPLKPHQVAASAPTPDRSTTPAERMTREWRDDLTNPGPLQKPFLTDTFEKVRCIPSDTQQSNHGSRLFESSFALGKSARQPLFIVTATLRTSFPSGMMVTD
jgi:hypothetical protein